MKRRHQLNLVALLLVSSFATSAQTLSIASWNMEWLTSVPSGKIEQSQRSTQDIGAYRLLFKQMKPAVLSFQEVNDIDIIRAIVGDDYKIFLSDRAEPANRRYQFSDINQYTGFAISKSLTVSDPTDVVLSRNRKLRFASYIVLQSPQAKPIHLLNVHLKAGCINQFRASSSSCSELKQQAQQLNQWLLQRSSKGEQYIISGDFNHNLTYPGDWMWQELTRNIKPTPELKTRDTRPDCKVKGKNGKTIQYRSVIDHMIGSPQLAIDKVNQVTYPQEWLNKYKLSDHCPIKTSIQL